MKGGRRARAGAPKLPVAIHVARGTYRVDKHGPVGALVESLPEWRPKSTDLAKLGDAGRELVTRVLADFTLGTVDGLRLLEAAAICDKVAALRAQDRAGLLPAEAAAVDRAELGWRQLFARHLDALGIVK